MLKLNDIIQYQKDTPKNTISSIMSKTDHEDTEFIHTIINIYNNKITKSNNKYYNLLYKTSIADKKRDEFIKNCDLNPITIISNSEKEEDPSSQISHHHRKLGKSDDDNEKKDNHDHRIDHRLASTQEKKYSHHHVHLSYIYLFQIFGELTSHLEDNIKKGMSGYHDDKLFQVIKNKKKQLGRLKKLEHDYDLQKYKLEGIRKEEYQFRYQEMPKEYERILALLTNTTQEYIELCIKILQEYDILNRRKEHKEKEHLSHKLNHMLNHKTIDESNENNKFNENFGNNENNENKKKIYSKTQDYKYLLEEKKHPESYHTAIKKEALNQKKEKILPTEELMKRSQKKTMKDLSKDSKEKKLINKKSKCLNRSSHNQKNDDYDRSKESINNNKSKKKGERSFTLTGPKDKKLDIISVIESEELIDDFDLTSKTIQEDPSMTYAYPYETSIHSTNDGAAVFSLPNTIQESLINSSKDALSKFPSNIKTNKISSNDIMYSIPSTPPPQYSSPKTKKMNHYYPPPPPLSPIISEFPTFLQQGTEIPITPGSVPIPLSNQHPSAPPLDNYMMNLRTDINVN
ncbi:hypothetical protein BCR36DRAFT_368639 [Piromyces finnis]|uniref:Uncharacterized protein n=1 Tax=Piromyces finnis TaxID=1754191 RepID=A0A1Y1VEK6_9FUNG|nr:hypothetical protein BCR36DRAFT_368639 [Piromyces finnis]|eukprot:ORX54257.1 hypothetical protein BCR36DRAFT_368639 [Piromyces finnis]